MKIFIIGIICLVVYALSAYFLHKTFQYIYRDDPDKNEPYTKRALIFIKLLPVVNTAVITALVIILFYVIIRKSRKWHKVNNTAPIMQRDVGANIAEGGLTGVPEK